MPLGPGAIKKGFASRTGPVLALIWLCATLSACLHRPSSHWVHSKSIKGDFWTVDFFEDTGPNSKLPFVFQNVEVRNGGKIRLSADHCTWNILTPSDDWLILEGESALGGGSSYHDVYIMDRTGSVQRITLHDGKISLARDPETKSPSLTISALRFYSGQSRILEDMSFTIVPTPGNGWRCNPAANRRGLGDGKMLAHCAKEMAEAGEFGSMGRAVVPLLVAGAWDEAARLIEARLLLMQPQVDEPIPLDQVVPDIMADVSIKLGREYAFILDLLRGHAEAWSHPYQAAYLTRLAEHMAKSEGP